MELRPYQEEDVQFLAARQRAACFNEQRTGKTPTILRVIVKRKLRKALIICPASATYPWKDAFETWTGKPCVVCAGTMAQQEQAIKDWTYGLVISYDLFKLRTHGKDTDDEYQTGRVQDLLACNPDVVIADEAQRFRNPFTATARAIYKTSKIPNRYALSGTPTVGKAHEIYGILHWLFPEDFRSPYSFQNMYFKVHHRKGSDKGYQEVGSFKPWMKEALQLQLEQFSTQRKRKEVMPWLPAKDQQIIRLPPTVEQLKYITELEDVFETEDLIVQGILDRLIRIRQICLAPALLHLKGASPKAEWVLQFLQDYPEKPALIFSKFTGWLKHLEQILKENNQEVGVIFGDTPKKLRAEYVARFQSGKLNVLLINIDAGKEALTLDRAEVAIFTDKYPPAGDIQQAEDRFVATTLDRSGKPHTIYTLVTRGTYEEDILRLLDARSDDISIVNDYKRHLQERRLHGNRT